MFCNISQIFLLHKTCRYYNKFDSTESLGVRYWCIKIPQCGLMEHGLKDIAIICSKPYNTLHSCHNFPAGSQQAARGARICETSLLGTSVWHQQCDHVDIHIFQEINLPDTHCVLQVFVLVRHIPQQYIKTETEALAHGQLWNHIDNYRKISKISGTLLGYEIIDHSDVVGASPVGAAPTTSSFSTWHLASRDSAKTGARHS